MKFQCAEVYKLFASEGGIFANEADQIASKWKNIKAIVLDWDGVFNDGHKTDQSGSSFSEIDSMGLNLLRFGLYSRDGQLPPSAILTGMDNSAAIFFARRERFTHCFYGFKNKIEAFHFFCKENQVEPHEVAFWFDDILDLPIAELAGLRIYIPHQSSHLLKYHLLQNGLADYICASTGGMGAIRESCELLLGLEEIYSDVVSQRANYDKRYEQYFDKRQAQGTSFYTTKNHRDPILVEYPIKHG